MRPRARRDGLLSRGRQGEVVVYDLERHEAHCLNPAAALVFRHSDGRTSIAEIAGRLHAELGVPVDERLVWLALEQLDEARLLERPPEPAGWSRRETMRRVALGLSVLLPAVTSILVPTPAEAAVTCRAATLCNSAGPSCYIGSPALCDGSCTCQPAGGSCTNRGSGFGCCDGTGQDCSF